MPIDSKHELYSQTESRWTRCRDAFDGSDAIKKKGGQYLPMLEGQSTTAYAAYLLRALFFGATQRTIEGMVGAIMRKDPTFEVPKALLPMLENANGNGVAMVDFSKQVVTELFITNRVGVLVERQLTGDAKPYLALYKAESIINWEFENNVLQYVVLRESYKVPGNDKYSSTTEFRYRELLIEDGYYLQRLHTPSTGEEKFTTEDIIPTQRGKRLLTIPFTFGSSFGVDPDVHKPPILDLADINLSHYRTSADLEHGRHFTALPTIYCTGITATALGDAVHIGSGKVLVLPPPEAKAGIIEFTGQGLQALSDAIVEKEGQMAKLGARMLAPRVNGVESAETTRINAASEESVTVSIANATSAILTKALADASAWEAAIGDVEVMLNTDIIDAKMDSHTLAGLLATRQAGEISASAFTYNLLRGEMLMPNDTVESERDRISLEGPSYDDTDTTE